MNISIRNIEYDDIPDVVDIRIRGWQVAYKNIIDQDYLNNLSNEYDKNTERIQKNYNYNGFIVALKDDKVVGFCRYIFNNNFSNDIDCDSELLALYVKPELKGLGIGNKLFNYVVNEFKNNNKHKMILWCLKENYPSRMFYEHMGCINKYEKSVLIGNKNYLEVGYELKF